MTPLSAALKYLQAGLRPIPVRSNKQPLRRFRLREYLHERSPTIEEVIDWWSHFPNARIALVCGFGFVVLDVEVEALDFLDGRDLPITPTVRTQGGGLHFWFNGDGVKSSVINVNGRHIGEVRSTGCYVLAPPSRGTAGRYEFLEGRALGEVPLAESPGWVLDIADYRQRVHREVGPLAPTSLVSPPSVHPDRSRDDFGDTISMLLAGSTDAEVRAALAVRPSTRDRSGHEQGYVELTLRNAQRRIADRVFPAIVHRVRRYRGSVKLTFRLTAGAQVGQFLALELDYPPTECSRTRWAHLCDAVGVSEGEPPEAIQGRALAVELVDHEGRTRIGRFTRPVPMSAG